MNSEKWAWWEILLWAYSTVWILIILAVAFLHVGGIDQTNTIHSFNKDLTDFILFLPVGVFMVRIGITHLHRR
jgi:UDP-N-acetylmuramyl pentapeptide phosphotransferase/UDP-N-acetylglucosamine-1-phosphate transferase